MSWVKTTLITGLMTVSGGHVYASPLSNEKNPAQNNWQQLIQVVSQNSSQPPDVIIDSDSNNSGNRTSDRNSSTTTTTTTSSDTRFTCDYINGEYTVMYNPESRGSDSYPWAIPSQLGGNWTPERRCNEITSRLESYRDDGLLEMSTGVENGYDTVCVTTQIDPTDCRIVLTVPPGQDPQVTRDLVFENLLIADDGQQTQGVYTYGDDNNGQDILGEIGNIIGGDQPGNSSSPDKINLRPFLDPADGGTGTKLKNNAVSPSGSTDSSGDERKPAIFE
ncbi:COP23 domain-containing protein [Hyella patelloides]|nr:COP23 domain-containing protein [Hyella patelloides]